MNIFEGERKVFRSRGFDSFNVIVLLLRLRSWLFSFAEVVSKDARRGIRQLQTPSFSFPQAQTWYQRTTPGVHFGRHRGIRLLRKFSRSVR